MLMRNRKRKKKKKKKKEKNSTNKSSGPELFCSFNKKVKKRL